MAAAGPPEGESMSVSTISRVRLAKLSLSSPEKNEKNNQLLLVREVF